MKELQQSKTLSRPGAKICRCQAGNKPGTKKEQNRALFERKKEGEGRRWVGEKDHTGGAISR